MALSISPFDRYRLPSATYVSIVSELTLTDLVNGGIHLTQVPTIYCGYVF